MDSKASAKKLLIGIATAGLIACGGGDSGGGPAPAVYTGLTTPAVVVQNNVGEFNDISSIGAGGAPVEPPVPGGGDVQQNAPTAASATSTDAASTGSVKLGKVVGTIKKLAKNFDVNAAAQASTAIAYNFSVPGDCGGSASMQGDLNETTGVFSFSMSFNNLMDFNYMGECDGSSISGSIRFSGKIDPATINDIEPVMLSFSMDMPVLSFSESSGGGTMSGNASYTRTNATTGNITMTMNFRDDSTGQTFRIENLDIDEEDLGNFVTSTTINSGRVYLPDYGYVALSTPSPLVSSVFDPYPRAGILVMTGAQSIATLTFGNGDYTVLIDDISSVPGNDVMLGCTWYPDVCNVVPM